MRCIHAFLMNPIRTKKVTFAQRTKLNTVKLGLNLEISVTFVTKVLKHFPNDTLQKAYSRPPPSYSAKECFYICEGL